MPLGLACGWDLMFFAVPVSGYWMWGLLPVPSTTAPVSFTCAHVEGGLMRQPCRPLPRPTAALSDGYIELYHTWVSFE